MNYILFDTNSIKTHLLPLTYFRPIAEMRCGIFTMKEKWEHYLKTKVSYLTDDYLQEKFPVHFEEENIYIDASVFPENEMVQMIKSLQKGDALLDLGGRIIAYNAKPKKYNEEVNLSEKIIRYNKTLDGITYPYHIFQKNAEQIQADFEIVTQEKSSCKLSKTNTVIGSGKVFVEEGAQVEAVTFNTQDGDVYIGKNVTILEGSLIRAPFAALENSVVKMGSKIYGGTTLGPNSKVGGEIKEVVFFGNANKGHDGYLGDAVIGEWCNLGANTNNSNLKNNYSNVKLYDYAKSDFVNTGLQFCGLIMGDHSKSGIATMFNTGTVVGVNANVFGSGYQPKFFPSFKWGGKSFVDYRYDKALEVAKVVSKRRNIDFDQVEERLFKKVYEMSQKIEKKQ
jgi:UDP-N-acetylglucosamine diphosphorylase/glucosamine-1-phosphate N-acetyltransferase